MTLGYIFRVPLADEATDKFDSDDPTLNRKLSKKGSALRLKCIGKQESDENPLMRRAIARNAIPPSSLHTTQDDQDKPTNHISPGMLWYQVLANEALSYGFSHSITISMGSGSAVVELLSIK